MSIPGMDDHKHTQSSASQTTAAQMGAYGQSNETNKEEEWIHHSQQLPHDRDTIEFETKTGHKHFGIVVSIKESVMQRIPLNYYIAGRLIVMTEDTEEPLFFSMKQIHLWRKSAPFAKRRMAATTSLFECASPAIILFLSYFLLRVVEKMDNSDRSKEHFANQAFNVEQWREADGNYSWSCRVFARDGCDVTFITHEGKPRISVEVNQTNPNIHRAPMSKSYDFKDVAMAVEEICAYLGISH